MQNHPHSHVLHAVHKLITDKIGPPVGVSVGPECNRAPGLQGTHPFDFLGSIYSIVDENQQRRRRRLSLLSQRREQLLQKLKCPKTSSSFRFSLRRILFAPPKSPPSRQPASPSWPPPRRRRRGGGSCSASDIGHGARWRIEFTGGNRYDLTKPLPRKIGARGNSNREAQGEAQLGGVRRVPGRRDRRWTDGRS